MYNKRDKEQIRAGINKVFVDAKIFSQTVITSYSIHYTKLYDTYSECIYQNLCYVWR